VQQAQQKIKNSGSEEDQKIDVLTAICDEFSIDDIESF
jgi:hypothetical protein